MTRTVEALGNLVKRMALRRSRRLRVRYATSLLEIYMHEMNSGNMRCEFEYQPYSVKQENILQYVSNLDKHIRSLEQLKKLLAGLKAFRGLRFTRPNPYYSYLKNVEPTATREISAATLKHYEALVIALGVYVTLANMNATDDELTAAILSVAYLLSPEEWRRAGVDVPDGHTDYGEVRLFLEAACRDQLV